MAEYDDIKTSTVALVGFLGAIVLVAILFLLQVIYYHVAAVQFEEKDVDPPILELQNSLNAQQAQLAGYRWVDQAKGVVAIPIDRAMELVVRETPAAGSDNAGGTGHAKSK